MKCFFGWTISQLTSLSNLTVSRSLPLYSPPPPFPDQIDYYCAGHKQRPPGTYEYIQADRLIESMFYIVAQNKICIGCNLHETLRKLILVAIYVDLRKQTIWERFVYIRSWDFFLAATNVHNRCSRYAFLPAVSIWSTVGVAQGQFFSMIVSVVYSVHERC
jgi:hypothetical protein